MSRKYKYIIGILGVLLLIGITLVWVNRNQDILTDSDTSNTTTISEGRQLHLSDIDIALGSVNNDSAVLVIHKEGESGSTKRTVAIGDKFEIYGHTIEVKSMSKNTSFSLAPGSSNGQVKLLIDGE